eukprot:Hpha_TRINITY_DN9924_c0_g1::TRINITY_DN9924_c0_g1_i1::g.140378::m.140378
MLSSSLRTQWLGLAVVVFLRSTAAAGVRSAPPGLLYPVNNIGRYPEEDSFVYTTTVFPRNQLAYSCGQYVRIRLNVSGNLGPLALGGPADTPDLSAQDGKWQWLNTSAGEAGLMLVKHYVGGETNKGINWCNSTAEEDVLLWTTDLGVAAGEEPVEKHSGAAAVTCGVSDATCVRDGDGQALSAFATFEMPCGYSGEFRVCYRKSVSRFENSTSELGWWSPYQSAAVGNGWNALSSSWKHAWQDQDGELEVHRLNATAASWLRWNSARSSAGREGEWVSLQVHVGYDAPFGLSANSDVFLSDQARIVPAGTPCISEQGAPFYPGTSLASADGAWADFVFDRGLLNWGEANGTLADRVGGRNDSRELCPHRAADSPYEFRSPSAGVWYVLLFLKLPAAGSYEICYSAREDRAMSPAFYYNSGGKLTLDPGLQGAGGWRKLGRGEGSTLFSFTVGTPDTSVTWSASDLTPGTWGYLRLLGTSLGTQPATRWDTGPAATYEHSYDDLVGGDMVRLVPLQDATITGPETPDGCWSLVGGQETRWLMGPPWSSPGLWQTGLPGYGSEGSSGDGYFYLRVPSAGAYVVCYRPAGGSWRELEGLLEPMGEAWNATWYMNDTRQDTWGPMMVQGVWADTLKYDWQEAVLPDTRLALKVVPVGWECAPSAEELTSATAAVPLRFVMDMGLEEWEGAGKADEKALPLRREVAAWIEVPPMGEGYTICLKRGMLNWQTIGGVFSPSVWPSVTYHLQDTRAGTWGRFQLSSPKPELSTLDAFRLVPNHTRCDRSSSAVVALPAGGSGAFCASTSSDPSSPCYNDWTRDQSGVNPLFPAFDSLSTFAYLTLPDPTPYTAYKVCHQQLGMNWFEMGPELVTTKAAYIALVRNSEVVLPGGTWHRFTFVFTTSEPPVLFDTRAGKDAVKLVADGGVCSDVELQSAITFDLVGDAAGVSQASAEFALPWVDEGNVVKARVCYRNFDATGTANWAMMDEVVSLLPPGITYSLGNSAVYRAVLTFRFVSSGLLDTRPGADAFKLISWSQHCRSDVGAHQSLAGGAGIGGLTDLGPGDNQGEAVAEARVELPQSGGPYRVCYKPAGGSGRWTHLLEELGADRLQGLGLFMVTAGGSGRW